MQRCAIPQQSSLDRMTSAQACHALTPIRHPRLAIASTRAADHRNTCQRGSGLRQSRVDRILKHWVQSADV
jgi:hypothetical protein